MRARSLRKTLLVVAAVVLSGVLAAFAQEQKPKAAWKTLTPDQIPAEIAKYATDSVPGITISEATLKTDPEDGSSDCKLAGTSAGRPVAITIETGAGKDLREIKVLYETDEAKRKKGDFVEVAVGTVPTVAMGAASQAARNFKPVRAEKGTFGGAEGYMINGVSGDFDVEVKVLADGRLIAIEKELAD